MEAKVKVFVCSAVQSNAYIVNDEQGNCILIDPGCSSDEETNALTSYIAKEKLKPLAILLTHGHFDHAQAVPFFREYYNIKCWLHPDDEQELLHISFISQVYDKTVARSFKPDYLIKENENLLFGLLSIQAIHIPGHTAGSVCFYNETNHWLFTGDTLMKGSLCFTNGSYTHLLSLLKERIFPLPPGTQFFFGHGPASSIEEEKTGNPFFARFRG